MACEPAASLRSAGHRVWLADDALLPGQNVALETGRALDRSKALVVLVSPQAMTCDSVLREIEFALAEPQFRGRLLPVLVKPTDDMPWILNRLPVVRLSRGIKQVVQQVSACIEHGFELSPVAA